MDFDELRRRLQTVVAITVTPFDSRDEVDFDGYRRSVAVLVDGGISVLTPNGNTSEFYSLTAQECRRSVEVTLECAGDALVMPGVGHDARTAAAAAAEAATLGAHAVMVHQPVHPYRSRAGWVAYHRQIADAAPQLGVVPYLRDAAIDGATLAELFDACPNVVGVKYAVPDPLRLAEVVAVAGAHRVAWLCGLAENWAPFFWTAGATGFTSGLATVAPEFPLAMLAALRDGDTAAAMAVWATVKPFEDLRARDASAANVSVVKEALAQQGVCSRAVRPPISEVDSADADRIAELLALWKEA